MVLPRTSAFGSTLRSSISRTARLRARSQWRTGGRRTYADAHGHGAQKASSDLPWLIGSIVVTVPSAAWLWQQGPTKGEHGHKHGEHEEHEEHEGGEEESKDEGGEEGKDEGGDESKEEGGDDKSEESDDGPDEQHEGQGDSGKKAGTPGSPQTPESPEKPSKEDGDVPEGQVKKGKGEKQKGETRPKTETKGEKDTQKDKSGANNPYLDDPEKSKKGEGVKETAKIHGTVDTQRNARGPGDGEQPQNEGGDIPKDTDQGKTKDSKEGKGQHKGNTEEGV